ncbi:MAG TPA: hypothetical protein VFP23_01575 [Solirubrobacterales bacterium]|nr:hypothetical protein [Solirubrobacterales bacterium]
MNGKQMAEQAVMDAVAARGEATVEEVAVAAGIGKTSARKTSRGCARRAS